MSGRCLRCGYDLRGNSSGTCPECGTGVAFMVRINDVEQYHRARAALERDGLLIRCLDPGANLGSVGFAYGMSHLAGWLWVDSNHLDRIEVILDDLGVASSIGALPIVDRAEPNCPRCNACLNPDGDEQCRQCGAAFQWVEIDADAVPNAAIEDLKDHGSTDNQPRLERVAIPRIVDLLLLVLFVTIVAFLLASEEWEILQVVLLAAGTALAGYFINKYIRRRRR